IPGCDSGIPTRCWVRHRRAEGASSVDSDPAPRGPSALVDETAAAIRARIMSGEIPIGAQLRQAELAAALGVSRTPIREALRQLQAGGLIEVLPRRGAVVRVPAP